MTPQLKAMLAKLPDRPGVYLMKDARGTVLYVGKAASLRSRVRSYWQKEAPGLEQHLIRSVIDRVEDLEYTMTDSVGEALLLEGNLVKRFQPPFNVRLKDDKSYPYIKITLGDDFPRIERTRKLPNDGSRYFGPYASASSVDEAMNLVRRLFPFRTCTIDIRDGTRALQRPCLLYHIKRCQGPCIEAISKDAYRADIDQVELFLEGRQESLVKALGEDMKRASERQDYEQAAIDRDKIKAIERTMESQKMAAFARTDLDLLGLARRDNQAAVQLFVIRGGKALGRDVFMLDTPRGATDAEVVSGFLLQYYARATSIPPEIAIPLVLPDAADLERFLADRRSGGAASAAGAGRSPGTIDDPHGEPHRPATRRGPGHPAARAGRRSSRAGPAGHATTRRATPPDAARDAQRRGDARARAGALAGRSGQDAGRPGGARGRPRAARAAGPHRVLRRLELPGQRDASRAWSSSRTASRGRGSTAASESGRSRAPTTSRRTARCFAGGSVARAGRRGQRRGTSLGDAGPRDHRWRQAAGGRRQGACSTSSACTKCRSRGSRRNARSSSCRTGPSRSCSRRRPRRCTWSSESATRRIGSRSPITATSAARHPSDRNSTTCRASAHAAAARSSACSAR